MGQPSAARKKSLTQAARSYHRSLAGSPAAEYLESRGLADADRFRLGYVEEPAEGHSAHRGKLAIPYWRWTPNAGWFVITMRFRCVSPGCEHGSHGKYMSNEGDPPRLYNAAALLKPSPWIAITEGEIDAMSATLSGVPAVGVPGVDAWKPYWREPFLGYETVYLLADNDQPKVYADCGRCKGQCKGHNPGMDFANGLARALPNLVILPSDVGKDVNSEMVMHGREYIRRKVVRT